VNLVWKVRIGVELVGRARRVTRSLFAITYTIRTAFYIFSFDLGLLLLRDWFPSSKPSSCTDRDE